jgi:GNAT superfamily N-acetyltransferase
MAFDGPELVGYVASALVVASLAMTSVVRLRLLSLAGSIAFVAYGTLIGSIPIVVTNAAIAVLNVWFLSRELGGRRDLGAVVVPADSPFLADFLEHHAPDIARFQPEYDPAAPIGFALVLTRDGLPAGVLLGDRDGDRLDVRLDYVLKAYRDSRLGRWLYGRGATVFRSAGIGHLSTEPGNETHRAYLQRVGFTPEGDRYTLTI